MKNYIKRRLYIDKITPYIGKDLIKVLVGQRRVGKSVLMYQIMDIIKRREKKASIIYINRELNEFVAMEDQKALYDYVKNKAVDGQINYLFVDEVQTISGFENALKSLLAEGGYDIYCTGSNADILSGELATYLGGRYVEVKVYPLGFSEFLVFHGLENNVESMNIFLRYGGLPYLKNLPLNDDVIFDYLRNIYMAILFRDVVERYRVRNVTFLERLVLYLAKHTGTIISARNIVKFLKSQRVSISVSSVLDYLSFLSKAFFVSGVRRSDITGKQIFEIGEKYYFMDIGLRNVIAGFSPFDMGLIIENAVYNHLLINSYSVLVGKDKDREVDFICEKGGERKYLQVALRIEEEQTESREFGNLLAIPDNYPKYVITMDEYSGTSYQGIEHLSLRKFLSGDF